MSYIFGNISPKNYPIFWDGMKYYYSAGVNASRLNTSRLTDFSQFFRGGTFQNAPEFSTQSMTRADNMFVSCSNMRTIPSPIDCSKCTIYNNMFSGCSNLREVRFAGTINGNLNMAYCSNLTSDSIMSVCYCMASGTLTLASSLSSYATTYVKVVDGSLVVSSSTDPDAVTLAQYMTDKGCVLSFS